MKRELEAKIVELRQSGKSMKLIAEELGVKLRSVSYFCNKNGLGGNRATECRQHKQTYNNQYTNTDPTDRINSQLPSGFEYAGAIQPGDNGTADIRCKTCGTVTRRSLSAIRHSYIKPLRCPECDERERKAKAEERAEQIKKRAEARTRAKELRAIATSKQITYRQCPVCGSLFIGNRTYCGQRCQHRASGAKKEAMRRARIVAQCIDSDITIEGLIARDGNRCYLCGCETDFNDHFIDEGGAFHTGDSYPTIEHVVPLAKGGTHSWANTKVACFGCNTAKGTRLV